MEWSVGLVSLTDLMIEKCKDIFIMYDANQQQNKNHDRDYLSQLYDEEIFGLYTNSHLKMCPKCKKNRTECIGHYAAIKMTDEYRYVIPGEIHKVSSILRKNNMYDKKWENNWSYQSNIVDKLKHMLLDGAVTIDFFKSVTSQYVLIPPLLAQRDFIVRKILSARNESRITKRIRKLSSYFDIFRGILQKKSPAYVHTLLYNALIAKRECVIDLNHSNIRTTIQHPSVISLLCDSGSKKTFVRRYGVGTKTDKSVRGVIICDPELAIDQVGVTRNVFAYMSDVVPYINRQPTLDSKCLMNMRLVPKYDDTDSVIGLHPATVSSSFRGDFDGDEMNIFGVRHTNNEDFISSKTNARLQSLHHLMYTEIDGLPVRGTYNAIAGCYIMTKWPRHRVSDNFKRALQHKLLTSYDYTTYGDLHHLLCYICLKSHRHLLSHLKRVWRRSEYREFEQILYRLLKDDSDFLMDALSLIHTVCDAVVRCFGVSIRASDLEYAATHFRGKVRTHFDSISDMDKYWQEINDTVLCSLPSDECGVSILVDSQCKPSTVHLAQVVACYGPVVAQYFISEFISMCNNLGICVFVNGSTACAWIPNCLWNGLSIAENFVIARAVRQNVVTSVISTADGGYCRRRVNCVYDTYTVSNMYTVGNGIDIFPPVVQTVGSCEFVKVHLQCCDRDKESSNKIENESYNKREESSNTEPIENIPQSPFFQDWKDFETCFLYTDEHGGLIRGTYRIHETAQFADIQTAREKFKAEITKKM